MLAVAELAPHIGLHGACRAFALNRGFVYRACAVTAIAPATVFATLLDEGHYYGSIRTMYRLLAIRPNEVWSRDITKLKGPAKWTCFHLYVILDIYRRYVVGGLIAAPACDPNRSRRC